MKKSVQLLLLSVYLISATEIHQLLKTPQLLRHYSVHQTQNNKITFINFLFNHYMLDDDGDTDEQEDQKLPFKTHNASNNLCNASYILFSNFSLLPGPMEPLIKSYNPYASVFIDTTCPSVIWQPPKIC